ncbi:MAG: hypothetical protein ABFD49_06145 [Armatimonadota bacterium]|nr:hypothetical protein [bacterium]
MIKKSFIAVIIAVFLGSCALADGRQSGRVVLIVAGGMSVRDVANPGIPYMELKELMKNGCGALMNVRTGRSSKDIDLVERAGMEPGCVSLGAGAMAVAGAEARRAAGVHGLINGVEAGETYTCRTAGSIGCAQIVHPEIGRMWRANEAASYRARPGALGSVLHNSGIKTAVIGNSDIPGEMHREAVTIAMDESGLVDYGDIDSTNISMKDKDSPYGIRANQKTLLREFDRVASRSRFIVIDFGDTFRADAYSESCTDEQAVSVRQRAARHLDEFATRLSTRLDFRKDTLIILSPSARTFSDIEEERLVPVIAMGPEFGPGALISPSTRRAGLITIIDIAPTVAHLLNVKPQTPFDGRAVERVACRGTARKLLSINLDASGQGQRQPAMRGGSVVQSVIVVLVTMAILLSVSRPWKNYAAWLALVPIALPTAMLYLPLIYDGGLVGAVLWLIGLVAMILFICSVVFRSPMRAMAWLCGLITVSLMVDLLRGAPLISSSIAGYSAVEGARYYGIGNELMGTMLGAAIVGMGIALSSWKADAWKKWVLACAVYALALVFIGAPNLGVNLGGALATIPALGAALLARREKWPGWRSVIVAAALAALALGIVFGADIFRGGEAQSHVGRALSSMSNGDILTVAQRKIALNFMLLSTSVWSRLLGLSIVGVGAILLWARKKSVRLLSGEENAAAIGVAVGVAGAFAFNDSGVVAAACCVVVLWMLFAMRSLEAGGWK